MLLSALLLVLQCPDGAPPPCGRPAQLASRPAAPPAASSIAVLPFANRSPDAGDAYLAEGLTEEISNRLTRVGRLQVKARGLVNAQWQRTPDPFDAARRLNVAWFVHGNVRHVGQQLLVNVELVRATTGEEVWASRFPRPAADVFAVQAEVAESVAAVVGGRLSPEERAVITARPTTDNEAYRLYLRGNVLLNRRGEREVAEAVQLYTQATTLDPRFAHAWARLGMANAIRASWPGWRLEVSRESLMVLSGVAIRRALLIDSLLPEAWIARALHTLQVGQVDQAYDAVQRAARRDSANAEVWYLHGLLYGVEGGGGPLNLPDQAVPMFRRSLALDPSQRNAWRHLALSLRDAGQLAEAEAALDSALAMGPWETGNRGRAYVRYLRGNLAGARADAALDPDTVTPQSRMFDRVLAGDTAAAGAIFGRLAVQADSVRPHVTLARIGMLLGRSEDALDALRRMWDSRPAEQPRCGPRLACSAHLALWRVLQDPVFTPLRSDPRFARLLAQTRPRIPWLPEYR